MRSGAVFFPSVSVRSWVFQRSQYLLRFPDNSPSILSVAAWSSALRYVELTMRRNDLRPSRSGWALMIFSSLSNRTMTQRMNSTRQLYLLVSLKSESVSQLGQALPGVQVCGRLSRLGNGRQGQFGVEQSFFPSAPASIWLATYFSTLTPETSLSQLQRQL